MSRKRNIFTTYGTLRVSVVEALDLVDNAPGVNKKVKVTKSNVFAVLKVTDDNGVEIKHCNTETHPFYTSETMTIGEEFIFENVSSAHNLLVSFYSVALEKEKTQQAPVTVAQNCLGFTQIPLARLEENVPIMQWHQLFSSTNTGDGLRSAVRIECNFSSAESATAKPGTSAAIRRTGSTARHNSEYNYNASRGSMYFDDYIDEVVEDEEEEESHSDSDYASSDGFDSVHKKADPERVFMRNVPHLGGTFGSPSKLDDSLEMDEEKKEDGSDVKLKAGIIDYCVVLGPAEPFALLKPSHAVTAAGTLARINSSTDDAASTNPSMPASPLPSMPYTGLFSPDADSSEEQEVVVWDRLPRQDHFDSELPSKLEWFACPEGSKTVLHHKRPDPYYQSFVLSSGGETEEVFGLSINFFMELSSHAALDPTYTNNTNTNNHNNYSSTTYTDGIAAPHTHYTTTSNTNNTINTSNTNNTTSEECEDPAWWRRVRSIDPNAHIDTELCNTLGFDSPRSPVRSAPKKLYTVVSLCVLFRASQHVQQLRKCLEYAYYESILPHLVEWEVQWERVVRDKLNEKVNSARSESLAVVSDLCSAFSTASTPTATVESVVIGGGDANNTSSGANNTSSGANNTTTNGANNTSNPNLTLSHNTVSTLHTTSTHTNTHNASHHSHSALLAASKTNFGGETPKSTKLSDVLASTFRTTFAPFSLHIERLMAILCLECPVPIPGFLSVKLQFPGAGSSGTNTNTNTGSTNHTTNGVLASPCKWQGISESYNKTNTTTNTTNNTTNTTKTKCIEFSALSPEDFPTCSYPMEVLLKCFGPRVLIDIVCCVLSECRILFHSSDLALLPVICESLRTLIYPLQWTHVYLPVVPMHLLNVVEAPVPFMLGTHSKWLKYIQIEYMSDMVLIDCDTASIDMGGSLAVQFPEKEDRWLMMGLRSILHPDLLSSNDRYNIYTTPRTTHTALTNTNTTRSTRRDDICTTNTKIQLLFYDVLFHLLRYVPDCLFYLNPSCPVFNRPLFISDYASDEYRPALELITVTNCFHVLTESIHTPSLAFFYKHIVRVSDLEKKILDQTIADESRSNDILSPNTNNTSTNSLTTPQVPRGGLRRTNSGSGTKSKAFTRNVSVANIIYDKLVSVSSPQPSHAAQGFSRQSGVKLNEMEETSSKSHNNDTSNTNNTSTNNTNRDSPKVLQHAGRGLMKHISIMGMSLEAKDTAPKAFFGSTASLGFTESPNEGAYSSLLPMWLIKPTVDTSANNSSGSISGANSKVDSVKSLLDSRLRYYVPFLKDKSSHDKALSPKGSFDSIMKLSGDSTRSIYGEHILTIRCEYAADPVAVRTISALNVLVPTSPPTHDLTATPMSKSRVSILPLPRGNSAHQTLRASMNNLSNPNNTNNANGASQSFKQTPRAGSRYQLKSAQSALSMKSSNNMTNMSLPVLTNVPSFRHAPTPVTPATPLTPPVSPVTPRGGAVSGGRTNSAGGTGGSTGFSVGTGDSSGGNGISISDPSGVPVSPLPPSPLARLFSQHHNTIHEHDGDASDDDTHHSNGPHDGQSRFGGFGIDDSDHSTSQHTHTSTSTSANSDTGAKIITFGYAPGATHTAHTAHNGARTTPPFSPSLSPVESASRSPSLSPVKSDQATEGTDTFRLENPNSVRDFIYDEEKDAHSFGKDDSNHSNHSTHSRSSQRSLRAESSLLEAVIEPPARSLIEFDDALVTAAQVQSKRWTVLDLARACDVPSTVMLLTYSKMRSFANSKLCENTQFAARHRAINTGNKNKRMLNTADTQATFDRLGKVGNQQCDECITMFLQKVVTESILEEHWLEDSVQQCIKALQDRGNRKCLIDMLKNAKQNKGSHQQASKVYPLNPAAFEAFSKLFSGVLRICSNQEDYLCAYGLLEVGGLYFRFIVRNDDETNDSEYVSDEIMEFLSERTCQHPIYHNSAMWCELMKSRVPVPSAVLVLPAPVKAARPITNTIMSEVHSLLYIMLELEVNSSRALLFIQGVASDYGLGINEYYKLQRSVNRIWANNHVDEVAASNEAEHQVANLHKPEHMTAKKRSKENLRDRRASMSIGDMLSMQGHSTSKLFRQSSVESMHGRTASMKLRAGTGLAMTAENAAELGRSPAAITPRGALRRNSLGAMAGGASGASGASEGAFSDDVEMAAPVIHRTRSKSLHASKSGVSLSIDIENMDSFSGSSSGKMTKSPALYPANAATPMHPRNQLRGIDEHQDVHDMDSLSFSKHSGDLNLGPGVMVKSLNSSSSHHLHLSDSDSVQSHSARADSSPTTPRMEGILPGFFTAALNATTGGVVPSSAPETRGSGGGGEDKGGLDEMLGLQRVSSAMLMRSTSLMSAKQNSAADLFEAPKNLPNQFAPLELTGREEGQVTVFDCADSWLVTGTSDGAINITDLATGVCSTRYRHGSGSGDKYRGITALHCLPTPCPGSKTALFFTGCSNGIVKAWPIPTTTAAAAQQASPADAPSGGSYWGFRMNLRLKNSISVMKAHTAPITALISKPVDSPAGWLLASGDEKGMVCLTRGTEKSSSTTCASTIIHPSTTRPGNTSRASSADSANGRETVPSMVLTAGKLSISCLSFIGTPALSTMETGTGKSKTAKKATNTTGAVSAGATGGTNTGTEEYLGVGTSTGLISVLDLVTATPIYQVAGHTARVTQLIGLRANEFISCSADRSIKLWDIRTRNRPTQNFAGRILEERCLGASNFRKCAASPITAIAVGGGDNSLVISTSADGVVRLWDRRYDVNVPCCVTQGHTNRITAIAWNGVNEFHTASHDGTVRTWDSINGQNTFMLQAFDEEGITNMKMTSFKCAQHVMITPRGPVTFTDHDKLSQRTCIVTSGWNGTIKSFVHDV